MTARTKILAGLAALILAVAALAFAQERRQQGILEAFRLSLAPGDSREKVEERLREYGLQPEISPDGKSYRAPIWFHFRPDVSLVVVLNGPTVDRILIKETD